MLGHIAELANYLTLLNQLAVGPGVAGCHIPGWRKHILAAQLHAPGGGFIDVDVVVRLRVGRAAGDEALGTAAAGADFVKTSTGFNGEGATPEVIEVMLNTCDGRARVKPSGGIRDWERAVMFLKMGVHRLGVGSADKILDGASPEGEGAY